jgi:hypothetical protein
MPMKASDIWIMWFHRDNGITKRHTFSDALCAPAESNKSFSKKVPRMGSSGSDPVGVWEYFDHFLQ